MLATQTLIQSKSKNMRALVEGKLPEGVTAKDIILAIIGEIGTAGGTGYALEYAGEAIRALSMEGRMTVCNMSVEGGAKAGFIAPDEKAYDYLKDKPKAPKGKAWDEAMRYWETLRSDDDAHFDHEIRLHAAELPPLVTWGTSPEQIASISGRVPVAADIRDEHKRHAAERSLGYMGLKGGEKITDIKIDRVFIGSCTNARIEDLRAVASVVEGKTVNGNVNAMIVPGSGLVKEHGGSRRPRQDLQGRRLRLARAGLLHVPGHEPGQAQRPASAAPRRRTATSKAARATRAVRTWCRRRWRRRRRSPATSSTCASGSNATLQRRHSKGPPDRRAFFISGVAHQQRQARRQ